MSQEPTGNTQLNWMEAIGLPQILRTFRYALHPAKLGLALLAILLTFGWGILLDTVWVSGGVGEAAIGNFITSRQLEADYEEPDGDVGIFSAFRRHEQRAIQGLMGSVWSGDWGGGFAVAGRLPSAGGVVSSVMGMWYGVLWIVRHHFIYFLLFGGGGLLIWSLLGGAICRIAALHFAREEKATAKQGVAYARQKLFDGFFFAPCIPVVFIALVAISMIFGGVFLRIPVIGDVVGGLLFFLAILGGFLIALLLLGFFVGGNLFWPAVAAEGSDAFDAFSRAIAYVFSRPIKTAIYAILMLLYASVCWMAANLVAYLGLAVTRAVVSFGTAPFGWWARGNAGTSKLELIWPLHSPSVVWSTPNWSNLAWYEYVSAGLVATYVMLVVALLWSFLCTFYFSGSTVIYFLLRRDVDLIDIEDIYSDEPELSAETPVAAGQADQSATPATP